MKRKRGERNRMYGIACGDIMCITDKEELISGFFMRSQEV
jgi:hypothetical protein